MLPKQTPERVVRAHQKITPIFEFLAQYEQWLAEADDDHCDFALGNPQTMPLEGFVSALRDATTPQSPDWYAYKMSEPSSREIIQNSLLKLTQRDYSPEDIFLTNGATGALLVTMNALIEVGAVVDHLVPHFDKRIHRYQQRTRRAIGQEDILGRIVSLRQFQ